MKSRFIFGIVSLSMLVFFNPDIYSQKEGIDLIDSLKAALPKLANDTNKVKTLADLSYNLCSYNLDNGVRIGKKALILAHDLHYNSGIAISRLSLSYCYFFQSNIPQVIDNLLEAEPIFRKTGDFDRLSATYILLAAANGRFDSIKMVDYYFKAKSTLGKTKSDKWRFSALSWILNMSHTIEPDSSDIYNSRLLEIAEHHKTPEYLAWKYNKLAVTYENKNNFDSGFYYRNLSLPLYLQLMNKRKLAEWYYQVARKYWNGNKEGTKNYITRQKASEYFNLSISISKESGDYGYFVVFSYYYLFKIQKDQKQFEQALFSLEQYDTYYQKMISSENARESAALTWKNENKIEAKELELLKRENTLKSKIIIIGTIGIVLMFLLIIIVIIIWRKNLKLRRQETDNQLITLEQKALQSMMNPHFIFNALGSIQNFLLQNKPEEAGLYLSQFARLIRQNLSAINSAMINLEDEVDRLKNYLDLERLRMENKFDYTIEFENGIEEDEMQIPSMIIQPFVENAIWHGISALEGNGFIRISFAMQSLQSVRITIEDNGVGIKQTDAYTTKSETHLHLGMSMTRKRLEIIGKKMNVATSVEISESSPGSINPGTQVLIVVPVSYGKSGKN